MSNIYQDQWRLVSLNDGLFISDKAPGLPLDGALVLNVTELTDKKAQAICDAHNAALEAR